MLKYYATIFTLIFLTSAKLFSQDQLIYKNKSEKFVDKILTVTADSISYKIFKKTKTIALLKISGYYTTVNTPENLKRRFYKRERTYHAIKHKIPPFEFDPNKSLINRALTDLNKFNANKFKDGFFIQNGDTNNCKIFLNKKNSPNNHLFIVTMDSNGNKTPYRASEIDYYFVNNNLFKAHKHEHKKVKTDFFLKLTVEGAYSLYERNSIPSHQEFTYFLKKEDEDFYYVMFPDQDAVEFKQQINSNIYISSNNSRLLYSVNNSNEDFKKAVNKLFGSCLRVKNKVFTGFYTQHDLPTIVREYNQCK